MRPAVKEAFKIMGFNAIDGMELHPNLESAIRACQQTVTQL
jgi:hypothetical protein